jgi:hypothetical protein
MFDVNNIVSNLVEVKLANIQNEHGEERGFSVVRETLTRIGIASFVENKLHQTCCILHKKGKYYIVHFKEMFLLDGKHSNITEDDKKRRDVVINLLQEWGLVTVVNPEKMLPKENPMGLHGLCVIASDDKQNWELVPKYTVGHKSNVYGE